MGDELDFGDLGDSFDPSSMIPLGDGTFIDPSTGLLFDESGNPMDPSTGFDAGDTVGPYDGAPGSGGGSGSGGATQGLSLAQRILGAMGAGSQMAGAGTQAAGQNRLNQEQLGLQAAGLNLQGMSAMEDYLMKRAQTEQAMRQNQFKDVSRANAVANPRVSPFDIAGGPKFTSQYMQTVNDLANQGSDALSKKPTYGVDAWGPAPSYTPINLKDLQSLTGTQPGFLEQFGNVSSPIMAALAAFANPGNGMSRPQSGIQGSGLPRAIYGNPMQGAGGTPTARGNQWGG